MQLSVSRRKNPYMLSLRPSSILQLTITGFLAMTVLLVAAVIIMANQLDTLSKSSAEMITKTARAMRAGSNIIEQTIAMERNARQYIILGDRQLLAIYSGRKENFIQSAAELSALDISREINVSINKLLQDENNVFGLLQENAEDKNLVSAYPALLDQAYRILYSIDEWINNQLADQRLQTDRTRRLLTFQVLLVLVIALFLAGLFTILITRPLRQIDRTINYLGSGHYDTPIHIQGPRDLQELGQRLDWLRNRLSDLEQQRTFFMHHVSHELKTPLAAILEGTALFSEGVVGQLTTQQNEIINILRKNCRRLQELIENLLRYNVENLATLKPMPHPIRLEEVIERVLSDHKLAIKSGHYRIVLNVEKLTVQSDLEQIRVVLDNLISNAVKYSPRNGTIEISLRHEEESAVLVICDEGPGIPPGERTKVFEPYYQGQPPADTKYLQGTGLGLAITREYVHVIGGTIEIMDVTHGTCVRVRIPIMQRGDT
jgi:two-component system sensor histidine kinase GlrK